MGGPYTKGPTIWGTILGSPIFGNSHMDWQGRVGFKGQQILFHADRQEPSSNALMFLSARGDDSGWWCSAPTIARILGTRG